MGRFEKIILLLLAVLLVLGMLVTLFFGRGQSRHGYGIERTSPPTLLYSTSQGGPCSNRG